MSVTPACRSLAGIGRCPHSGIPGAPTGPAFRSTITESASMSSVGVVDARRQVVDVLEDDRAALRGEAGAGRPPRSSSPRRPGRASRAGRPGCRPRRAARARGRITSSSTIPSAPREVLAEGRGRRRSARRGGAGRRSAPSPPAARPRSRSPPSGARPPGLRLTSQGVDAAELVEAARAAASTPTRPA